MSAMISPSLARATWNGAAPCLLCCVSTRAAQASQATSSSPFLGRHHRRASSKASSPPKDSTRPIATTSNSAAAEPRKSAKEEVESRSDTRTSRQKSKDNISAKAERAKDHSSSRLPFVPSTQHLHPHDIYVASFFSIHRPMSVTASVPPLSSSSGFSSIFSSRQSSKPKPADVIYTLSSAVKSLENETGPRRNQLQSNSSQTIPQEVDMQAIITEASTSNAGNATPKNGNTNQFQSVHLDMANLAQTFRPYNVPPPPIPMDSGNDSSQQIGSPQSAGEGEAIVKQKSFSTVVTILENTHQDGSKSYSAESSPIRENTPDELIPLDVIPREKSPKARLPGSQPFLQRMLERQEKWDDFREETKRITWGAISVRRQRKLKMKKHKYKKLMRRTRNLRRRQDRL